MSTTTIPTTLTGVYPSTRRTAGSSSSPATRRSPTRRRVGPVVLRPPGARGADRPAGWADAAVRAGARPRVGKGAGCPIRWLAWPSGGWSPRMKCDTDRRGAFGRHQPRTQGDRGRRAGPCGGGPPHLRRSAHRRAARRHRRRGGDRPRCARRTRRRVGRGPCARRGRKTTQGSHLTYQPVCAATCLRPPNWAVAHRSQGFATVRAQCTHASCRHGLGRP